MDYENPKYFSVEVVLQIHVIRSTASLEKYVGFPTIVLYLFMSISFRKNIFEREYRVLPSGTKRFKL